MLRNVYFEGEMGDKFLPHMQIDCENTAEVFRCLDANFSEFMPYLAEKHEEEVGFHIEIAGQEVDYLEECIMTIGEGDFMVTPVPAGSGKGFGKILAAVAIIALVAVGGALILQAGTMGLAGGLSAAGLSAGLSFAAGTVLGKIAIGLAIGLALSGLAEMMAPDPSVDAEFEQDQSYLFNGQAQNIIQGDPVPVLYGKLRVPGQPISFEMMGANAGLNSMIGANGSSIYEGAGSYFSSKTQDAAKLAV